MRRFLEEDLKGAEFRECELDGARFVGVVMQNVAIDGLVTHLVVNGVDVVGVSPPREPAEQLSR